MGRKINPFLAKLEQQAAERQSIKSEAHVQIDTMAMLLAAHDRLQVGPGRADGLLNDFLAWKLGIAEEIVKEIDQDQSKKKELVVVKRDLAQRIKEILGPDAWEVRKYLFPFLQEFW